MPYLLGRLCNYHRIPSVESSNSTFVSEVLPFVFRLIPHQVLQLAVARIYTMPPELSVQS